MPSADHSSPALVIANPKRNDAPLQWHDVLEPGLGPGGSLLNLLSAATYEQPPRVVRKCPTSPVRVCRGSRGRCGFFRQALRQTESASALTGTDKSARR